MLLWNIASWQISYIETKKFQLISVPPGVW